MGERFDWDRASEAERDAQVARVVMGLDVLPMLADVGDPDYGESVWTETHEWTETRPIFVTHCHCDSPVFGADDPDPSESVKAGILFKERHGHKSSCCAPVPRYSTDPTADFLVLEHVRNKYGRIASKDYDSSVWGMFCGACGMGAHYQPGIYSESALAVLRERKAVPHD